MFRQLNWDVVSSRSTHLNLLFMALATYLVVGQAIVPCEVRADDPKAPPAKAVEKAKPDSNDETAETAKVAPIEIPDGSPEELLAFANKTMQNRGRDMASVRRAARAVVDTAAKIRTLDKVTLADELKAIELQLPALQFLATQDKDAAEERTALLASLAGDNRPAIRNFAMMEELQSKIRGANSMDVNEQQKLVDQVLKMADEGSANAQLYGLAALLATRLNADDQTKMAVDLLTRLADQMDSSDDEQLQDLADRARGTARRLELLGNTMTLTGTTGDGKPFDWSDYRGRVVLVDFWASWCGPCRGEIPNMKRNLAAYGDQFAIVGINMDTDPKAMESYLDKEAIGWVNIVGVEESGTGWSHPMARYYGVSSIPTAILVDQQGNVVSLSARGKRLDDSLEELLGPPPETQDDDAKPDADVDASEEK